MQHTHDDHRNGQHKRLRWRARACSWLFPATHPSSRMVRFASLVGLGLAALATASPFVAPQATRDLSERDLLGEIIDALGIGLVTSINATITLDTLTFNNLSITFEAQNPLIFELTIDRVNSTSGINGTDYASFDYTFPKPVVIPPLGTANSGTVPNVLLPQGAVNTLSIIPLGYLDINVDVWIRALTIDGALGIPLTITGLKQSKVPVSYSITV
ncbi:hypothetical protein HMN09_00876000 [Mycena chlorophos]|uniref:Uncharacterized protein n=1 Tax=Mycena chlorophos TaxID=658473 RepID=A0A8H6SPA3_MYCCL|nr:hypothetical protein HMN09_00876000 [Mycena chlorophos]